MFNTKNQELENKTWTMADFLSNGEDIDVESTTETEKLEDTAEEEVSEEEQEQKAEEDKEKETSKPEESDPPAQELDEEEEKANPSQNPTVYAELLSTYIEEGDWEDAIVEIEGEEVQLSELKSVDKETFLQIKAAQKEAQQERLKEKYIDIEGLDETDLELINLKKSGGDWTYLLKQEAEMVHPLEGLDLENENTQLWLLAEQYKSQGMDQEAINMQLQSDKKNFKLDEKAKKVVDNINNAYKELVAAESKKKQQEQERIQQERKELAKNLRENYKSMKLSDSAIKRYVETATKDLGGGKTKLDSLVDSYKNDPEKLAKLAYFLEDEKGFLEFNGAKQKNKQSLKTIKLISQTQKQTKDKAKTVEEDENDNDPWSKMTFKKPVRK